MPDSGTSDTDGASGTRGNAGASGGGRPRIVVLGGGFGGLWTARHLEKLSGDSVEITLVSRDNFFLLTPLLFEAFSGTLALRHCSLPVRDFLRRSRFVEATVTGVDLDRRRVQVAPAEGDAFELPYDHLVVALGAVTNRTLIPGSEAAFTFKTLGDALLLRNHVLERFERADVETDPERKRRQLTFVVVGGGLVGVELFGELTALAEEIARYYPRVGRGEPRFHLLQAADRFLPEVPENLAAYAVDLLGRRRGAVLRAATPVLAIEPGRVRLEGETIAADTIVLAAGIAPSPVSKLLPLARDRHGYLLVDGAMRSHERPEVWVLGDCASVPDPAGKPYPYLAQHAMREARVLAENLSAVLRGQTPRPFAFESLGILASLGHARGLGSIMGLPVRGFLAWWVRRTYYLLQMPRLSRRVRIVADWTVALFFRPDITKYDVASEGALLARNHASGANQGGGPPAP